MQIAAFRHSMIARANVANNSVVQGAGSTAPFFPFIYRLIIALRMM